MNKTEREQTRRRKQQRQIIGIAVAAVIFGLLFCGMIMVGVGNWLSNRFDNTTVLSPTEEQLVWGEESAELTIAVSPLMAPLLETLATAFNEQSLRTADGETMQVQVTALEPANMVRAALEQPNFQAISPDSNLWIDRLETRWQAENNQMADDQAGQEGVVPVGQQRTSGQVRYAISPVVIVAWETVARDLGWPDQAVGWQTIQQKATADSSFKWNHASTDTASGLLATLAEFYAGAGITRGLTEEAATAQRTLDYVRAVEGTVRFYGEGESVIPQRLATEGRSFLDAFVAQERVVVEWNRQNPDDRLIAIYPAEGSLWTDHPLALLELGTPSDARSVTDNQRLTYKAFADYLLNETAQQALLTAGYRPADLGIDLSGDNSPFANTNAIDWRQPQTTLQIPPPSVVEVVQNSWYYTKRPTNVYLVVDTSGSMAEGNKLGSTKEALRTFVEQIRGERDQVGLIDFASGIKGFAPLRPIDDTARNDLLTQIDEMDASGGTALVDALFDAVDDLLTQSDSESINAIVVMTDGQENESNRTINELQRLVAEQSDQRLVIFTVAFGIDADERLLEAIAAIGDGLLRRACETDIVELYRIIST